MPSRHQILHLDVLFQALLIIAAAGIVALAFPPYRFYLLTFIGPAVCYILWERNRPLMAFFYGWLFGISIFAIAGSWLSLAPRDFAELDTPYAELTTAGIIAFINLHMGIAGALYAFLNTYFSRYYNALVLFPTLWVSGEWLRGWAFTGFPWFNLGYPFVDSFLTGWAPVFGIHGMSFAVIISTGALILLFHAPRKNIMISGLILLFIWYGGSLLQSIQWTYAVGSPQQVALIQSPDWDEEDLKNKIRWENFVNKSLPLLAESDIIIWPETIEHIYLVKIDEEQPDFYVANNKQMKKKLWSEFDIIFDKQLHSYALFTHEKNSLIEPLEQSARQQNKSIVLGISSRDHKRNLLHNSLLVLGNNYPVIYDKRHLIPFGEFYPLQKYISRIWPEAKLDKGKFNSSRTQTNIMPVNGYLAGVAICYEAAYPDEVNEALPQANFFIMVSNDRMFMNTAEPEQHQQIIRIRALETGRWIARANKTAITSIISPDGQVIQELPPYISSVLKGQIQPVEGSTPYSILQDKPFFILVLFVAFIIPIYKHYYAKEKPFPKHPHLTLNT